MYNHNPARVQGLRAWTLLAVLSAAAAALQVIESPLPRLLPWLKPGLANSLTLYALVRWTPGFCVALVVLRTLIAGLALGMLLSPANLLSLAGGLAGALAMWAGLLCGRDRLSLYGISIIGAAANNLAQLLTVQWMFASGFPLWFHLSVMLWVSIPSGMIVGHISRELLRRTA
ncbi:MAG TPA: Gx transporter family protein [Candidatus Ozemobacteraceae bacterium]|nr:Gx transporter family protein [Candidatus Ozemobacteraceae bacterium]